MSLRIVAFASAASIVSFTAAAQERAVEIAIPGSSFSVSSSNSVTNARFALTEMGVGFGFVVANKFAIEPSLSFLTTAGDGVDVTFAVPGVSVQYFIGTQRQGLYLRPYTFLSITSIESSLGGLGDLFGGLPRDSTGSQVLDGRPRDPALDRTLFLNDNTDVQPGVGMGIGTRVPIGGSVSLRFELGGDYTAATSRLPDTIRIGASMGLSVFLD